MKPAFLVFLFIVLGCGAQHDPKKIIEKPDPKVDPGPKENSTWFTKLNEEVFSKKCSICHNERSPAANLKLITYEDFTEFHDEHGWIVKPGSLKFSHLWHEVSQARMPPSGSGIPLLTEKELEMVKKWIEAGAPKTKDGESNESSTLF